MTRAPDSAGSLEVAVRPALSWAGATSSDAVDFGVLIDATFEHAAPERDAAPKDPADKPAPEPVAASLCVPEPSRIDRPLSIAESISTGSRRPAVRRDSAPGAPSADLADTPPPIEAAHRATAPSPLEAEAPGAPSVTDAPPSLAKPTASEVPEPPGSRPPDEPRTVAASEGTGSSVSPVDSTPATTLAPGAAPAIANPEPGPGATAVDGQAPAPLLAPETMRRVTAALLHPTQCGATEARIEIDLEPAQLGRVHLEIVVEGHQIRVSGWAAEADGARALQSQLPELRAALLAKDVRLTDFAVVWSGAHAPGQRRDRAPGPPGPGFGIFRGERRRRRVDVIA